MVGAFAHVKGWLRAVVRPYPDSPGLRAYVQGCSPSGEVARSSTALAWRWSVAGPGFPSGSNSGLRSVFSLRSPCGVIRVSKPPPRAGDSARDATPSFREFEMSSESPLNIRTGSHPGRKGTRLSGRIRETGRDGLVELRAGQTASRDSADAMLPPGHRGPALVKSCERYRCDRQGSILPIPMHGSARPCGQAFR